MGQLGEFLLFYLVLGFFLQFNEGSREEESIDMNILKKYCHYWSKNVDVESERTQWGNGSLVWPGSVCMCVYVEVVGGRGHEGYLVKSQVVRLAPWERLGGCFQMGDRGGGQREMYQLLEATHLVSVAENR